MLCDRYATRAFEVLGAGCCVGYLLLSSEERGGENRERGVCDLFLCLRLCLRKCVSHLQQQGVYKFQRSHISGCSLRSECLHIALAMVSR